MVLTNHINGRPVSGVRWRKLKLSEDTYRRTMLWCWGDEPERTAAEAAEMIRAAAALSLGIGEHGSRSCPTSKNMV